MEKYVGLKNYSDSKELMERLAMAKLPLTKDEQNRIDQEYEGDEEWIIQNRKYCKNQCWHLFVFLKKWYGKLVYRVFASRTKMDFRKKDNGIIHQQMEILRGVEGCRLALHKNCSVSCFCGYQLFLRWDGDSLGSRGKFGYYTPGYTNDWKFSETYPVDVDYLDRFIEQHEKCYTIQQLLEIKPELKYSEISMNDNPIIYLGKYQKYKSLELVRKLDLYYLSNNKLALKKIDTDKYFRKFLFKVCEAGYNRETFDFYRHYYKVHKYDMSKIEYEKKVENVRNYIKADNLSYAANNRYYYSVTRRMHYKLNSKDSEAISKYIEKQKIDINFYHDYLNLCLELGHNLEDEYWLYPNDFHKQHQKVLKQHEAVKLLNSKLKYDYLHEVLKDLEIRHTISGYDVFITSDLETIKKQCDVLYQCLIRNDYISKEIQQEEVLVFFWKDGEPKYTAEVFYDGKVGQFYGDERDRNSCQAPDELREILKEYLSRINLKKRKFKIKKKYYKGFYDKNEDGTFVGYNHFIFEVGKTYKTEFSDSEIVTSGASGCNATSKVFHFCESIEEISKHYSPKYYCEVEPLGPVLDCNGALLTNRLKIVRELPNI